MTGTRPETNTAIKSDPGCNTAVKSELATSIVVPGEIPVPTTDSPLNNPVELLAPTTDVDPAVSEPVMVVVPMVG